MKGNHRERYFFDISFEGTAYAGWNAGRRGITVKSMIDRALSVILHRDVITMGSSRTEKGMHARQFFFHADLTGILPDNLMKSMNGYLPEDIAVNGITGNLPLKAHAGRSRISETWEYKIHHIKDPFNEPFSAFFAPGLPGMDAMHEAAGMMTGKRPAFLRGMVPDVLDIPRILLSEDGYHLRFRIVVDRAAPAAIRKIVSVLLRAGSEKIAPKALLEEVGSSGSLWRSFILPSKGLHLVEVKYALQ